MAFLSESKNEFIISLLAVDTLVKYAENEEREDNIDNRTLFLKLAVTLMVTRFQVFVESILKEFQDYITSNNLNYTKFPHFIKLNSLKLFIAEQKLDKLLTNYEAYDQSKYEKIKKYIEILGSHFSPNLNQSTFMIKTKYPIGKTGSQELIDLFLQIEGKDIFEGKKIDINILDSILQKRHLIIHQDLDPGLSEYEVLKYQLYLKNLSSLIENYINHFIKKVIN